MYEEVLLSAVNLKSVIKRLAQNGNINFWKYNNRVKSRRPDFLFWCHNRISSSLCNFPRKSPIWTKRREK